MGRLVFTASCIGSARRCSVDLVLAVTDEHGLTRAAALLAGPAPPHLERHPRRHPGRALRRHHHAHHRRVAASRITTITTDPATTPAAALAAAADAGRSEHLLLLQTPVMGLTHDWLTRLIGYSHQPGIAAAGPVVLSPDGRIHQAGIAIPNGIPLPLLHGLRSSMDHFFGFGTSVYNVSAVSGVLATRRETYRQLGGLNPDFGDLAPIEYCLRATDAGQRIVVVPDARLQTTGSDPASNDLPAHLAAAPHLGPNPHPRPLLQPQLPHRPRRLRADPRLRRRAPGTRSQPG